MSLNVRDAITIGRRKQKAHGGAPDAILRYGTPNAKTKPNRNHASQMRRYSNVLVTGLIEKGVLGLKWFKHETDAEDSVFIAGLEKKFGTDHGYARWFRLLERIAEKMDKTDRDYADLTEIMWSNVLRMKPKILRTFLEHCENVNRIKVERYDNVIRIHCANLLGKRDNYTKNLRAAGKRLATQDIDKEIEEVDKNIAVKPRKVDPRSSSQQIKLFREITGLYPEKALYDDVIRIIGEKTIEQVQPFYREWVTRGNRKTNVKWLFEWLASGRIPPEGKVSQPKLGVMYVGKFKEDGSF